MPIYLPTTQAVERSSALRALSLSLPPPLGVSLCQGHRCFGEALQPSRPMAGRQASARNGSCPGLVCPLRLLGIAATGNGRWRRHRGCWVAISSIYFLVRQRNGVSCEAGKVWEPLSYGDSAKAAAVIVDGDEDWLGGQGVGILNMMKADDEPRMARESERDRQCCRGEALSWPY